MMGYEQAEPARRHPIEDGTDLVHLPVKSSDRYSPSLDKGRARGCPIPVEPPGGDASRVQGLDEWKRGRRNP